jgi:hypothetical protein
LKRKIFTKASRGITNVIVANGHLSRAIKGIYSIASGARNCTGEKKHNNVPKMTTKRW